ncbi:MAG: alpha-2-macroglobulin [Bacteroidales bacterium]|jgi:uncharacterized protein YfaS (alpha-2-macroglobulin family)|nr:alpha-2-macroglobulin [Bacteroidales bacterium]
MKINILRLTFGIVFLAAGIFSCKNGKDITPSVAYAPYISAYTGGIVSTASTVRIELAKEQPSVELMTEIPDKLFKFSPSLKGKAYWVNNKTLEFLPDSGQLKQGERYNAMLYLGKIMKVEKKLNEFEFSFRVIEQNFTLNLLPCRITADAPTIASVTGEIRFSDVVAIDKVKQMLSMNVDNEIQVKRIDAKNYTFTVENIQRKNDDWQLTVTASGKPVGIKKELEAVTLIPKAEPFRFLSASSVSNPENGIQMVFSHPVSQSQDLRGLISMPEIPSFVYLVEGNLVNIFFDRNTVQNVTIQIDAGIKNTEGKTLGHNTSWSLTLQSLKPQLRTSYSGTVLPDSKNLILPFEAVNLSAVDLKIIRIFESNVLMFLQNNKLGGSSELRRSGRLIHKQTLRLDTDPAKKLHSWDNYYIDLANIIKQEPGAVYRIELSFRHEYSLYPCSGEKIGTQDNVNSGELVSILPDEITDDDENEWDKPETYYSDYDYNFDWSIYNWEDADDPCKPSYYMNSDRKVFCNVVASNLGLTVKGSSDRNLWVAVNDILTTEPVKGVGLSVYNFQLQRIGDGETDGDGFAHLEVAGKAFVIVAEQGGQKTYLRLVDGEDNSLSRFDVGGKEIRKCLKGFVYGERGIWRPGDTLHLGFLLEDRAKRIPENHPVSVELFNPQGQFYAKQISVKGLNGFYTFNIPTRPEDPTGLWNACVKVGGAAFYKSLRVEAIKPNRLKINLNLPKILNASQGAVPVTLTSSWLTGATAHNLKTKVEITLAKTPTVFKGYENYVFNNPATNFSSVTTSLFDGSLNGEGVASFTVRPPEAATAPGMLMATLVSRVFEQGGDASINAQTIPFSPFSCYVGVNVNQKENTWLETDKENTFDVVTLSPDGKLVSRHNLEYRIYKLSWNWWWDKSENNYESYVNNTAIRPVDSGTLNTSGGKAAIRFRIDYPDWGRFLVYIKDTESGHATGNVIYIDWPSWHGRSNKNDPSGLTMITFATDKNEYAVGEKATVILPKSADGRALISLENAATVLKQEWIKISDSEDTKYTFTITDQMSPNFYIHATLLQPHAQTVNNLPIRMYGVVPVTVTNKNSKLSPQIAMPDVLRPETEFEVKINEKEGKPMTYTLAIVDDGLLDLTNFKTPDPWNEFYSREALGIKTWDMYDNVVGAFGGKLGSLFAVGGDEMLKGGNNKASRFKPVVKFIGPFELKKGKTGTHKLALPMYVGSVRVMLVAGQDGAYGKTEKTVPVRTPLMVLPTLPRVISTGEEISMPINIFAMEEKVKNVTVTVETTGKLQLSEGKSKTLTFAKPGDEMLYFTLKSGATTGVEKVTVTAAGNGNKTTETIEIDIRNPNPAILLMENKLLAAGSETEFSYAFSETSNGNWGILEVARIPSVDISRRFNYLNYYQHDCSEQLTSKAFPLLFVSQFKDVTKEEADAIGTNIREAIKRLYGRQLANGGFVYWPGYSEENEWITSYVGNFLLEAQLRGYDVNQGVLNKWKTYQQKKAQNWIPDPSGRCSQSDLQQAYRLYTLALSGSPEQGAMNRMKETAGLSVVAKWRLAAAYAVTGKTKPASEIIFNAKTAVDTYSCGQTFGSSGRDEAMILETLTLIGNLQQAFKQAQTVSRNLSREHYFSTQSTAFSLVAMGRLAEKITKGFIDFTWTLNGKQQTAVKTAKPVYQASMPVKVGEGRIALKNTGSGDLYVSFVSRMQPLNDTLPAVSNNLSLNLAYADLSGNAIRIEQLKQGADFTATVRVSNTSANDYTDLALTHILPSGWEVFNERLTLQDAGASSVSQNYTYRDIRDDRVLTYFDLPRGQTRTFTIRLQASYCGSFTLPAILCEAMYDTSAQARTTAGKVKVEK